jgi:hypothetical protein
MAYSNYKKLKQVVETFDLKTKRQHLFPDLIPIEASDWLKTTIEMAGEVALSNEKVKSERIISPILSEVHLRYKDRIALYSGEELNVAPQQDLNGACDFFFSAAPDSYLLSAPIFALAEAKDEDMDYGIAQCTAQMIGAQKFNEKEGKSIKVIWGCATTASDWRFLKLIDDTLFVDTQEYYLNQLPQILGAFHAIISDI